MLDKKEIQLIFLFKLKMGGKTVKTTSSTNNMFGSGTDNEHTVQWWFKKFAKETRASKMRSAVAGHRKLTSMQRQWPTERIVKAHPVITTREVAKDLNVNHSTVQHLRQTGKVRKLNKWVPHELKIKNIIILKCHLLLRYATTNHFSIRL